MQQDIRYQALFIRGWISSYLQADAFPLKLATSIMVDELHLVGIDGVASCVGSQRFVKRREGVFPSQHPCLPDSARLKSHCSTKHDDLHKLTRTTKAITCSSMNNVHSQSRPHSLPHRYDIRQYGALFSTFNTSLRHCLCLREDKRAFHAFPVPISWTSDW
jgi:hypothetical protein